MKKLLSNVYEILTNFWHFSFDAAEHGQLMFQCPATKTMDNIVDLHNDIFSIMIIIAAVIFYMVLQIIWKFNSENIKTKRNFAFTHHTSLEVIWTIIPMVILMLFLIPSFVLLYGMDELHDSQITLKIIGRQWYWTYEYTKTDEENNKIDVNFDSYLIPDSDLPFGAFRLLEVDNRVKLPAEIQTRLLITASDVLHSWAVPSFGIKMDACPGRLNQTNLFINRLGVFYGQCSELCGVNHGFMPIVVESTTVKNYINWLNNL